MDHERDIAVFDCTTEFCKVRPTSGFGVGSTNHYHGQHPVGVRFSETGEGHCGFSVTVRKITQSVLLPIHRSSFSHCAPFVHRLDVDENQSIVLYARPVRNIIFTPTGETHRFLVLIYSLALATPIKSQ